MEGLDTILRAAGEDFQRFRSKRKEVSDPQYSDEEIPWLRDVHTGEVVVTRPDGETRFGIFGPTGCGKTTVIKRIAGIAYQNGFTVAHAADVKNDFQDVNGYNGVPKAYIDELGLMPGEEPFEMPRTLAIPNFMARKHYSRAVSQYGTKFAWGFQDISEDDFKYLLGDLTGPQRDNLELVLDDIDFDKSRDELGDSHWDAILRLTDEYVSGQSSLKRKLKSRRKQGLVDDAMRKDVLKDLDKDEKGCVSLGLKYYSKYRNGGMQKLRFYSSIFQRNLASKIESGDIDIGNGLILVNDEFHIMDDAKNDMTFNREFDNILKIAGRQADISTVIASQRPGQVSHPDSGNSYDFLSDLTDAVLFRGKQRVSENDWKTVLRAMGIYRGQSDLEFCRELFGSLDRFQGVYVSSEKHERPEDLQVVRGLAPPVHHTWES